MKSLASSPLIPLATGLGAAALIFGTLSNDPPESVESVSSETPAEEPATPDTAGDTSGLEGTPDTSGAATAPVAGTLPLGKATTVGGLKMTASAVTAKGATVKVGSKSYTLTTKKAAKIGKYTVTVTKATPKKSAAVTVAGP